MTLQPVPSVMERSAVISPCGQYRYRLWRKWGESQRRPLLWVMLNPSTADGQVDDRTICRCIDFSKRFGYGSMWVGNMYGYRSTDPAVLARLDLLKGYGPHNARHLAEMAAESDRIVVAWGSHLMAAGESERFTRKILAHPGGLWCLGTSRAGAPRHPLYLAKDTPLQRYEP